MSFDITAVYNNYVLGVPCFRNISLVLIKVLRRQWIGFVSVNATNNTP